MKRSVKKASGTLLLNNDLASIKKAADILKNGGLVGFPTETVYGLGASALDDTAVNKIFSAKGRPPDNPLIVHISKTEDLDFVAADVPAQAYRLAEKFWPGPLSLVLQRSSEISSLVSAGLQTVAVRMPARDEALTLIKEAGIPVAAPSANLSGSPSPTTFRHVLDDLAGKIDAVIMGKPCLIGLESTVLDLTGSAPVILRPGGLPREAVEEALQVEIKVAANRHSGEVPLSPGMKYRHYTPQTPLFLITGEERRRKQAIQSIKTYYSKKGMKVGLIHDSISMCEQTPFAVELVAARLYRIMRFFDSKGYNLILAEEMDQSGLGLAVMNRLIKAAHRIIRV